MEVQVLTDQFESEEQMEAKLICRTLGFFEVTAPEEMARLEPKLRAALKSRDYHKFYTLISKATAKIARRLE